MEPEEMEDLRSISLRQTSASQLALLQRARPLDEAQIVQVGDLFANMITGYPHQALEMAADVYQMAFEDLARLYGMQQLETALRSFLTLQKFFPHPSEVREVLDEMAKKEQARVQAALPKLGCEVCQDQVGNLIGFVLVEKPGYGRVVEPCQCRIRRELAKKKLGAA